VIHSELDYRLPITEGLATFNVLQTKGIPSRLLMFPDENHVSTVPSFATRRPTLIQRY
jgi:dipeptidyl aminopeptidase/acylaminoacyl peptidase